MALPFLPSLGFSQSGTLTANSKPVQRRRMVCIGNMLGFIRLHSGPSFRQKAMTEG